MGKKWRVTKIEIIENEISSYIESGYSKQDEYVVILNNILLKLRGANKMIVKTIIIDIDRTKKDNALKVLTTDMKINKKEIEISNIIDDLIKMGAKEGLFNDKK